MFCTKCGNQVQDGDAFCTRCGQAVAPASPQGSGTSQESTPPLVYGSASPPPPPAAPYVNPGFVDPQTGRPVSEWWKRFVAYLLDGVIVAVPTFIAVFAVIAATAHTTCNDVVGVRTCTTTASGGVTALLWLLALGANIIYFVFLIGSSRGQTVGMMAVGIAVRDEREDRSIGKGRALLRWLVMFVLAVAFYIPFIIDCLSPLWDRRRQAWHDHAAGSIVVDVR